ncbi:MAG: hypothetical protein KC464_01905 [Myxococcales bacterium]|nr:hypothetical protein [Myxococcales bacterium]
MSEPRRTGALEIGMVCVVAVAIVGLISGVRGTGRDVRSYVASQPAVDTQVAARSYPHARAAAHGPNAEAAAGWFGGLPGGPDPFAPVVQSAQDRADALARRATRRAFDGAPPTIPHRIDQHGVPACLTCHDRGTTIAGVVAPRMSHERHDSCVQCHVVATDPRPGTVTPPAPDNGFVGLAAPATGERAWPGAPPTIPHTTRMRERCDACHGVYGALGMRSSHPWRASCLQCHGRSAELDQRAPVAIPRTP